jgi:hypothetical protein
MARSVHYEGVRERSNQRDAAASRRGKYDLGYFEDDSWNHICRYGSKREAESAKERLSNPSESEQRLIGVDGSEDLKVLEV